MEKFAGIPGTISAEAKRIRWIAHPGRPGMNCYQSRMPDGLLVAVLTHDPVGSGGKPLWHLSVSHTDMEGKEDRVPTWDELKHAVYTLCKEKNCCWILVFPKPGTPYVDDFTTALHLWESEKEIG